MRDLTNQQWEHLHPFLPPQKPKVGRPNEEHRTIVNGILWIDRTGASWRDLPERYGCWSTVASRFDRWRQVGVWQRILEALQQKADAALELDWNVHHVTAVEFVRINMLLVPRKVTLKPRHWVAPKVALAPKFICASKEVVSRWSFA